MLMDIIKNDWNTLKNKVEYEIIKKYTYVGAFYAQLFASKVDRILLYYFTTCVKYNIYIYTLILFK